MVDKLWFEEEEEEQNIQGVNIPSDIANDIAAAFSVIQQKRQRPYMPKKPLIDAYRALGDMSPDQIAHYQQMADEYGYTMATIMNLPEVRNDIEKRGKTLTPNDYDWDSFTLSAPKMAEILAREVYRMGIVRDDLDNIKQTEEILSKPRIPFIPETWVPLDFGQGKLAKQLYTTIRHSAASTTEGILYARYIAEKEGLNLFRLPDILDAISWVKGLDTEERMLEWQQYIRAIEENDPFYKDWRRDSSFFGKLAHGLAELMGQLYSWTSEATGQATWALLAALGASAVTGVGKMTGVAASTAGALLYPTVKEVVTGQFASLAREYGMLRAIQLSEMSGNYREWSRSRDIYGQGLDSSDMAKWSYVVSAIQAPIELMQLQLAASWVPIKYFRSMYRYLASSAAITSKIIDKPFF